MAAALAAVRAGPSPHRGRGTGGGGGGSSVPSVEGGSDAASAPPSARQQLAMLAAATSATNAEVAGGGDGDGDEGPSSPPATTRGRASSETIPRAAPGNTLRHRSGSAFPAVLQDTASAVVAARLTPAHRASIAAIFDRFGLRGGAGGTGGGGGDDSGSGANTAIAGTGGYCCAVCPLAFVLTRQGRPLHSSSSAPRLAARASCHARLGCERGVSATGLQHLDRLWLGGARVTAEGNVRLHSRQQQLAVRGPATQAGPCSR